MKTKDTRGELTRVGCSHMGTVSLHETLASLALLSLTLAPVVVPDARCPCPVETCVAVVGPIPSRTVVYHMVRVARLSSGRFLVGNQPRRRALLHDECFRGCSVDNAIAAARQGRGSCHLAADRRGRGRARRSSKNSEQK